MVPTEIVVVVGSEVVELLVKVALAPLIIKVELGRKLIMPSVKVPDDKLKVVLVLVAILIVPVVLVMPVILLQVLEELLKFIVP